MAVSERLLGKGGGGMYVNVFMLCFTHSFKYEYDLKNIVGQNMIYSKKIAIKFIPF